MRLDKYLFENSLAKSRTHATQLIKNGMVECGGATVTKPSFDVAEGCVVKVTEEENSYVGRGALKLKYALEAFGVDPSGKTCIDVGASTGGFTEILLLNGARRVYAVDSGRGQLDKCLLADCRVVSMEGFNARALSPDSIGEDVQLAVCDVSFISQTLLHGAIASVLSDGGTLIALVKPQFELTRGELSKGGIVRDAKKRLDAAKRVYTSLIENGYCPCAFDVSPITGGDGNVEYLICAAKTDSAPTLTTDEIERTVLNENCHCPEKGQ